ncbi:hypothetical protein QO004_003509 [Rhizobium mesoamericanum]|nr:hypothetical protein [Rhizobium mesoamericanum]
MCKTASRKYGVDLWHAERQAVCSLRSPAFHGGDALAKVSHGFWRGRSLLCSRIFLQSDGFECEVAVANLTPV